MTRERFEEIRKELNKYLSEHGSYQFADMDMVGGIRVLAVDINWGDWKHDHLRTDYLVNEFSETLENEEISLATTKLTEEDGSDAYSAIHYYFVSNKVPAEKYEKVEDVPAKLYAVIKQGA